MNVLVLGANGMMGPHVVKAIEGEHQLRLSDIGDLDTPHEYLKLDVSDLDQVVAGDDRGKQGRVLAVDRESGRVRVEKVRMQKRHLKAGRKGARTGGILEQEGFIDTSNVMLVEPESGATSRVRIETQDDRKVRVFAKGGALVPDPGVQLCDTTSRPRLSLGSSSRSRRPRGR